MALKGTTAYALSKKYTEDTAISLGAVIGAPCTIKNIMQDINGDNVVEFEWTSTTGTTQTRTMTVKNGVSITGFTEVDDTHAIWNYSDGTVSAPFVYPQKLLLSQDTGNALVKKPDGYYVSATGVQISGKAENLIETIATVGEEGLYVGHDVDKVDIDQGIAEAGKALVVDATGKVTTGDAGVKVSQKTDNDVQNLTGEPNPLDDGIYLNIPVKKVQLLGNDLTPDANGVVDIPISTASVSKNIIQYVNDGLYAEVKIDPDTDNIIQERTDGLFVAATPVVISQKNDNMLSALDSQVDPLEDGLYVQPISPSIKTDNDLQLLDSATAPGEEGYYVNVPIKKLKVDSEEFEPDVDGIVTIPIDNRTPQNIITTSSFGLYADIPISTTSVARNIIQYVDDGIYAEIPVDPDPDNIVQLKDDGLFVAATPIKVSSKDGNAIEALTDAGLEGLYVQGSEEYTDIEIDEFFDGLPETVDVYENLIKDDITTSMGLWSSEKTSNEIKAVDDKVGDITLLETTDQTDTVSAINEVNSNFSKYRRIKNSVGDITDLNELVETGVYTRPDWNANYPSDAQSTQGAVYVEKWSDGWIRQEFTEPFSTKRWARINANGTWYAWQTLARNDDLETKADKKSIANDWNSTERYVLGEFVFHNGQMWKCIQSHNGNQEPKDNSAYWSISYNVGYELRMRPTMDDVPKQLTGRSVHTDENGYVTIALGETLTRDRIVFVYPTSDPTVCCNARVVKAGNSSVGVTIYTAGKVYANADVWVGIILL